MFILAGWEILCDLPQQRCSSLGNTQFASPGICSVCATRDIYGSSGRCCRDHLVKEWTVCLLYMSRVRADDRYFLSTSRDMTARLYTLDPLEGFKPKSFGGHRDVVLGAWFSKDEKTVRPTA
jgi:hypothetical protein